MTQFIQLNPQLRVRAADIISLQDNGNGSTTVTVSRDITYTVQTPVEELLRLIEQSTPLTPVATPANDPLPGPAAINLGTAGDTITLGPTISPIVPGFESAAQQGDATQQITAGQQP